MATIKNTQIGTSGNDELTISKNGFNYVMGLEGDDKYIINNIKKSWTIVDDALQNYEDMEGIFDDYNTVTPMTDGGNDTVQINNVNANDLILFFDVAANDDVDVDVDVDESLAIVHKSLLDSVMTQIKKFNENDKLPSKGAVEIDYYFNNSDRKGNQIEHIQVSKGGVTKEIDVDAYISKVTEKVKDVLNKYDYSTAMEMLFESKASAKQIKELKACYKSPIDLIITGTSNKNDKIYAEAGADTIVFDVNSGDDTVYNAAGADKLQFEDVEVNFLMKNGNNLYLNYGNNNQVTLSNYYKAKDKLDTYTDTDYEGNQTLHKISEQTIRVTGKGKIYGTAGNDIVEGSEKADKIYGQGGNDELYGDWGNDVIYSQSQVGDTVLLAGEEGNDKLYAGAGTDIFYFGEAYEKGEGKDTIYNANSADKLRFVNINFDDLKFTKSGNNLVITIANMDNLSEDAQAAYKNFKLTLSNYFKNNNNDKLDTIEFLEIGGDVDLNDPKNTTTAYISDAKIYVSGSGKITASDFDDIITGGKKADKITTGAGDDVITGGKGNDTITLGAGNKELNFNNGDGNDTIYVNGSDSVKINLEKCDSIDYIRGQNKAANDLYIERKYTDAKGKIKTETIAIKNYFTDEPNISVISDGKTQSLSDITFTIKGNEKKGGELQGTNGDDILRGSDKVDTIWTNGGNDVIYAGKGNDIIHAEDTTCTINLNELDGVDTIYANSNSNIVLNYIGTEEDIRFFKSSDNSNSDLIIARGLDFKNDIVIIKDYYNNAYGDRPVVSYQFNNGDAQIVDDKFLANLNAYYYPDKSNSGVIQVSDENGSIVSISKSILFTSQYDTNDTYIVNNARNYTNISDRAGEDTLQVNNIAEDKLKMFFNVNKENGLNVNNQTLYLFDSKDATLANLTKCLVSPNLSAYKGVQIEDYFNTGKIEHITVADVNGDNSKEVDAQTKIYVIAREIQKYLQELSDKGKYYNSAAEVLLYGDSKTKTNLLNIYLKTDVEKIMSEGYTFDYRHNLMTSGSTLTGSDSDDKFYLNNTNSRNNYSNLTFNGGAGNDEYQINTQLGSANTSYYSNSSVSELNIVDTAGNDTYKIGANLASMYSQYGVSITDYEGDDNYELSTFLAYDGGSATAPGKTIIDDKAGNNTLSLVGDETNIGVRFSVTLNDDGGYTVGDDLIIVNSRMSFEDEKFIDVNFGGCGIWVKDYFENNNMSINLNGKTLNTDYLNQIAANVAGWLEDKGYTSTTEVVSGYNSELLLAQFNLGNVWQDTPSGMAADQM
ncbi:MAG: hypothetical protein NC200_06815 [Candidatus Gastranaerophilales bacterium]|nr:hypothetical protein [Candidatus Gastranaerophilales bacterium]